jgi:iron complex transport system permease protein
MSKSKFIFTTLMLLLVLAVLAICDLCFGSTNLFSMESSNPMFSSILYDIRLPKTLTSIIAGSGLALCGLLMQSLFRNPLAGPYVLGVSSGSSLFVAIATMMISSIHVSGFFIMGKSIVTLFSIMGAFFVTLDYFINLSQKQK